MKEDKEKRNPEEQDEGQELCPKCGNLMLREGGELICSSCVDDIDFFGEEDDTEDVPEDES